MVLDPYDSPILGWLAFGWLVVFLALLAITCVYETRLWAQQRQARHATQPATGAGTQR
jgi:Ca2+-dependent lipid-binding protein